MKKQAGLQIFLIGGPNATGGRPPHPQGFRSPLHFQNLTKDREPPGLIPPQLVKPQHGVTPEGGGV